MYIQIHRSVNIENRENTYQHIYIDRKHSCEVEQYDMRYLRKLQTDQIFKNMSKVKNRDNYRFDDYTYWMLYLRM